MSIAATHSKVLMDDEAAKRKWLMFLGIEKDKGLFYEGGDLFTGMRAVLPPPHLFDMQILGAALLERIKTA